MKKVCIFILVLSMLVLSACGTTQLNDTDLTTPQGVLDRLAQGNEIYAKANQNPAEWSAEARQQLESDGQDPYAIIVTCSDSRVPPEHIFASGLGELFVVRSAGNVLDDIGLGSVEYGAEEFAPPIILVMGHTNCGAVAAALKGGGHGYVKDVTDAVISHIGTETDARTAEILNVKGSIAKIESSPAVEEEINHGKTKIMGAIYDIGTGEVEFLK